MKKHQKKQPSPSQERRSEREPQQERRQGERDFPARESGRGSSDVENDIEAPANRNRRNPQQAE